MSATKKSWVFAAVFLGVFVSSARAQDVITAKVPFPFVVNHAVLPAGQYSIASAGGVTVIRGMNKSRSEATLGFTTPANGHDPLGHKPALVFTRYETGFRLSQIWASQYGGREFRGASAARRTARAETEVGPSDAQVYVLEANRN